MSFTFPRKEKLKSKVLLQKLFEEGDTVSKYPIRLIFLNTPLPEEVQFQAAITVPKRNFKSAVKRNRIKRLMREAYRLNKPSFFNKVVGSYALLFLYLGKDTPSFQLVEKGIKEVLESFIKEISNEKAD